MITPPGHTGCPDVFTSTRLFRFYLVLLGLCQTCVAFAEATDAPGTENDKRLETAAAVEFRAPIFVAREKAGRVRITLKRSGGLKENFTVAYATADGTARAGEDYTTTSGEFAFGPGVKSRSFTVPIRQDEHVDGGETIMLSLAISSGSAMPGEHATAVIVIAEDKVALSKKHAAPGQELTMRGPVRPGVPVYVSFNDFRGGEVVVRGDPVSAHAVRVKVPLFLDATTFEPTGGAVGVSLIQGNELLGPAATFLIEPLAESEEPPGTFAIELLKQEQALLTAAAQAWLNLQTQSGSAFDTAELRALLDGQAATLADLQAQLESLASGAISSIPLGTLAGREVLLDAGGLALLDRIIRASVLNGRPAGSIALRTAVTANRETRAASHDALTDFKNSLRVDVADNPTELFEKFDNINKVATLAIGIGVTGAVVLAGVPIAAAAAFAGTAGAMLFYSLYVVPATMGLMTYGMTADFVALGGDRPPEFDAAQPALDHLYKGSTAFLTDELNGRLITGALIPLGASADLADRANLAFSTSKAILDLTNPNDGSSLPQLAYAHAETIFANRPLPEVSVDDVLITEPLTGTATASFRLTLSRESNEPVVVRFQTASGSAVIGDYVDKTGSVSIPPGTRSKAVNISILSDDQLESDETFLLELSGADNATIARAAGTGTIRDSRLQWTIAGSFSANGETTSFTKTAAFARKGGTLTFPAGRATVRVTITKTKVTVNGSGFGGEDGVTCTGSGGGSGPIIESATGLSAGGSVTGNIHCVFDDGSAENYPVTGSFTATAPK
jgi:hypothetical protein